VSLRQVKEKSIPRNPDPIIMAERHSRERLYQQREVQQLPLVERVVISKSRSPLRSPIASVPLNMSVNGYPDLERSISASKRRDL
jgi:hypothetical protein